MEKILETVDKLLEKKVRSPDFPPPEEKLLIDLIARAVKKRAAIKLTKIDSSGMMMQITPEEINFCYCSGETLRRMPYDKALRAARDPDSLISHMLKAADCGYMALKIQYL